MPQGVTRQAIINGVPVVVQDNGNGTSTIVDHVDPAAPMPMPMNVPKAPADQQSQSIQDAQRQAEARAALQNAGTSAQNAGVTAQEAGDKRAILQQGQATQKFQVNEQTDNVLKNIADARNLISSKSVGWGHLLQAIPETDARALQAKITTIQADIMLARMQQLKEASAATGGTGSGLGNQSDAEGTALKNSIDSLDLGRTGPEVQDSLDTIDRHYRRWKAFKNNENPDDPAVAEKYGIAATPAPSTGLTGTVTDTSEKAPPPSAGSPPPTSPSPLQQFGSGANEGLANLLGTPVDVTTGLMNFPGKIIKALSGNDIPAIKDPFLGSDWIKKELQGTTIGSQPKDTAGQYARRIGQSVGSAIVPIAGTEASLGKMAMALLSAGSGGAAAETAHQIAPNNPGVSALADLLGTLGAGAGAAKLAQRGAQSAIEDAVPSIDALKSQAEDLYTQAGARNIAAKPTYTRQLRDSMRQLLQDEGKLLPSGLPLDSFPEARDTMKVLNEFAGKKMTIPQLQGVRRTISDGFENRSSADRRLSGMMLDKLDTWAAPLAPELEQARQVSSKYLAAGDIAKARELAAAATAKNTYGASDASLRNEFGSMDRRSIKYNGLHGEDLEQAIQDVARGTSGTNLARALGHLAPSTRLGTGFGVGMPMALGELAGGHPAAIAVGGAAATTGLAGRALAKAGTNRAAELADLIARNGGKLPQAPLIDPETQKLLQALLLAQASNSTGNK